MAFGLTTKRNHMFWVTSFVGGRRTETQEFRTLFAWDRPVGHSRMRAKGFRVPAGISRAISARKAKVAAKG